MRRWLLDIARDGWAARAGDQQSFEDMARQLVDAQAPGLSRRVRALGERPDDLVGAARAVGRLHLLNEALAQPDLLDDALAADLWSLVGVTVAKKKVIERAPPVFDRWWVLGVEEKAQDELTARSTWVVGEETGTFGLLLEFAPPQRTLPAPLEPGWGWSRPVHFYSSAVPLRFVWGEEPPPEPQAESAEAGRLSKSLVPVGELWAHVGRQRSRQPWLTRGVVGLAGARLARAGEGWGLIDTDGGWQANLVGSSIRLWSLASAAADGPLDVYLRWEGDEPNPCQSER